MEWISVKDKLPEDYMKVIILLYVGDIRISSVQKETVTAADQQSTVMRTWDGTPNCQVTHWMALPKLPKQ